MSRAKKEPQRRVPRSSWPASFTIKGGAWMKAAYTREIINPILPCKMEGYNEARFCFNQTAQQKQVSGEGLRTACGQSDRL